MSGRSVPPRVVATRAARAAIRHVRAARGPLMFYQSAGCCDGSLTIGLDAGELLVGEGDLRPEGFSLAAGDDHHFITRTACTSARGTRS